MFIMRRTAVLRAPKSSRPLYALFASACAAPTLQRLCPEPHRPPALQPLPLLYTSSGGSSSRSPPPPSHVASPADRYVSLLRRGRPRSAPTTPTAQRVPSAESGGAEETLREELDAPRVDRAVRAYNRWSQRSGGCPLGDFVQGAQQAYYGLGVLLSTLSDAVALPLSAGKSLSELEAVGRLKEQLSKHYGLTPSQLLAPPAVPNAGGSEGHVKDVAHALQCVLPISPNLAESLYQIWNKQRTRDANLFRVAAPMDYIVSTKVILFHECHNMNEVHFADDSPLMVMNVPPSPGGGDDTKKSVAVHSDGENKVPSRETETAKEATAKKPTGHTIITYKGQPLPPIPANAIACVVAMVDVVIPPQRYTSSFEWFYQRVTGHQSEYERIAVARIFASSHARSMVAPLDFLMRMLTGRHVEFMCNNSISEMIGIPKNIRDSPPVTRKLMCLYMDADRKWVLSDLFAVDNAFATGIPTSAAA